MAAIGDAAGIPRNGVGRSRNFGAEVGAVELEADAGDAHVVGRAGRDGGRARDGRANDRGRDGSCRRSGVGSTRREAPDVTLRSHDMVELDA